MTKSGFGGQTLSERLAEQIALEGPITFRDWMATALYDEEQGYYCRRGLSRWGRKGDYRTSPEITDLFAAVFARYFAQLFTDAGAPAQFTILEIGGGAGHFAAELLRSLEQRYPKVFESATYVLDEISRDALERTAERLAGFRQRVQFRHLSELGAIELGIVFSNELLDAFPVHRVTQRDGQLLELYVGLGETKRFEWLDGPLSTPRLLRYLERFDLPLREGQVVEINLALEDWFRQVAERLKSGYLVTVDYGVQAAGLCGEARMEGTLRSFQSHQFATDVLASPGEQDITSSIDWTAAKEIGKALGFELCRFERQDRFLLQQGLLEELELRVAQAGDEAAKMRLRTSAREMILPGRMAESFQVLVQAKGIRQMKAPGSSRQ